MKKLLCLLLALLTIGGCALAETENKTDEAVLNIFTWEGYIDYSTVIKPFEEETGIKVNYATFSSNEEMYEKLSAVNGGDYDVVLASDYMLNTTREAGLMQPFDPAIVDNYSNLNEGFTHQFFDPDDQYVVPYVSGIPLIVYDPSAVEIDIKGFNDLWDPSLEDSVALIANYRVINGITLLTMGKSMNEEDVDTIKEAGEKLVELAPNIRMIQDDNTQNALLNGEASVALLYTSQVTAALAEDPELKVVYPEEGLGFGVMGMFIPSAAPNAEAAYQFVDYILRPEIAAECFDYIGYYCTNKAADQLVDENLVVPDSVTSGESIKNVNAKAEEQYNKNWTEFKAACD